MLDRDEPLLPSLLRRQVGAIVTSTDQLAGPSDAVAPDVLVKIIRACRDTERLRVCYRDAGGLESERTLDPHRVVATARRWYLVARTSRACRPPGEHRTVSRRTRRWPGPRRTP